MQQPGVSLHLVGSVLGHSDPRTTKRYARFGTDTLREALDRHGQQILGAAGKTLAAEVIPMRKKVTHD